MSKQTICALATAPAPSGVAIIRVSGPETKAFLEKIFSGAQSPALRVREMIFGRFLDENEDTIDHGLAVFFKSPASFTGEDLAELHLHGSPLVAAKILRRLHALGAIPAQPGEFTLRAFHNGKIDLLQAEAIADLISATSEQGLKIATEQIAGKFSSYLDEIAEPLRDTLAEIEAQVDFPEEDINPDDTEKLLSVIKTVQNKVSQSLATYDYGHMAREGFRILITGKPNAGKSSLLNALLGRERAIVTDISGTTRDLIEESLSYKGFRYVFCDSAGITDTENTIEQIGIELAVKKIPWADMLWLVLDADSATIDLDSMLELLEKYNKPIWLIINKTDKHSNSIKSKKHETFLISAKNKTGIDNLLENLAKITAEFTADNAQSSFIVTNERQRAALLNSDKALSAACEGLQQKLPLEIVSLEIRTALSSLDEIIGKTCTEDILGRIFSKFCIGK